MGQDKKPRVSIVAAIGRNRELGKYNDLLWHIPEDLKRFKTLTLGHPVIMGRTTFESIVTALGKPLPGRTNIVISRENEPRYAATDAAHVIITHSIEEALAHAREIDNEEVFIGGGAQIYNLALPYTDRLYLTLIDDEKDADTFFPEYEDVFTKKIVSEEKTHNALLYRFLTLDRR